MRLTIKQLINELEELATAHSQVSEFRYGNFLDIIESNPITYTAIMGNISNATYMKGSNLIRLQLDLFVCDKTLDGDENKIDVENNTMQICNDVIGIISRSPRWQGFGQVTTDAPYRKYYDRMADTVTGWGATIYFDVIHANGYCDVPVFDYNYDASGSIGCSIIVTVLNTDGTTLSTKVVTSLDSDIEIPDINFTDSDGITTSVPSGVDLVCTPATQIKDLTIAIPYSEDDDTSSVEIITNAVGTITSATTTLTSVVYEVNAVTATIPFTLTLSDVLAIGYDAAPSDGTIILSGSYV